MALEQKLTLRLSQRLVMTPSLQQAIKLLQMSKLELVEEVQQELLENPTLEESQTESSTSEQPEPAEKEPAEDGTADDAFSEIDYESYFQDIESEYSPRGGREIPADLPTFASTLAEQPNLTDHLTWQLGMNASDERMKEIGRAVIGNLDSDGYLKATIEELQAIGGYSQEEVAQALRLIQDFDPIGVGAANLTECLCLQLKQLGEDGTAAEQIVRFHMDKVQNRRFKELAGILGLQMDDLEAEIEIVRGLDPRPGQKYNTERSMYIVPDVYIVKVDDEYQVLLNEDGLPRLRISPIYRRMVARGAATDTPRDAKDYVRNKLRAAFRLIKSLEERQRTIFKVATSIVKFQRGFLDHGVEKMKPLVLRDVADDIGMHESTVSRVVNQKYMHTHRGVFEMRFFFHSGISSNRGAEAVSSLTVKEKIRKIVESEDSAKPLSDSAIVQTLKAEGLQIARRTVAKYREELKIPSSSQRRRAFG
ncbi:MAG: RNA polymerase factor sigma-54 [Acidobacteria bacterium]|nr:MAG: RNA polymerase factor sigma-54 [Acidobacteriota bacterium]